MRTSWNLISLASALLVATTDACVQVTLETIANTNGRITDFQTPEDELYVWMGVSKEVMITWKNDIHAWESFSFSPGIVTMPCFHESVLWIEMEEQDTFAIEKTQIAMACKNLQLGRNKLITHIEENNAGIMNNASVVKDVIKGASFKFGSGNADKTAQYTFTFNVEQNCSLRPDQAEYTNSAVTEGEVTFMSRDIVSDLQPRMMNENKQAELSIIPISESETVPEVEVLAIQPKEPTPTLAPKPETEVEEVQSAVEIIEEEVPPLIEESEPEVDVVLIQPEEEELVSDELNKELDVNSF